MKKKVGILTLPLHSNYGGILQAYALYSVLAKQCDVTLLDDKMYEFQTLKEKLSLLRWNAMLLLGLKHSKHPMKQVRDEMLEMIPFIERYIPLQMSVSRLKDESLDVIVVGSDQVWRGVYSNDLLRYFLNFIPTSWSIKRVAYAASFGVDNWCPPTKMRQQLVTCAQQFDNVSVREQSGVAICSEKLGGVKAEWVLDPTMLLCADDYRALLTYTTPISVDKICVYILDRSKVVDDLLDMMVNQLNFDIIDICQRNEAGRKHGIEYWLSAIYHSHVVFTDSFHGTVFSILFNKDFIVIGNKERGNSRFDSLLSLFGLQERYTSNPQTIQYLLSEKIDWNRVNQKLKSERERSLAWLIQAIEK